MYNYTIPLIWNALNTIQNYYTIPNYTSSIWCIPWDTTFSKWQKGINGNIYILNASTPYYSSSHLHHPSTNDTPKIYPHIFAAFYDLPVIYSDSTIQAFLSLSNKEDTLTQSQKLNAHGSSSFLQSQVPEVWGLEKMQVFDFKPISTLPPKARLLSSNWSYQPKDRSHGELLKYKSCLCIDGSQQLQGRNYWGHYWSTVRLILLLSTILGLKSRQVDYHWAFPQAELHDPVITCLPQGWHIDQSGPLQQCSDPKHNDTSHYIQLKRNLYRCKQAACNWLHHLSQGILAQGFYQ